MKAYHIILAFLLCINITHAQSLTLDLADYEPGKTHTLNEADGDYTSILLKSVNPLDTYIVKYKELRKEIKPLPIGSWPQERFATAGKCTDLLHSAMSFLNSEEFTEEEWGKERLPEINNILEKEGCQSGVQDSLTLLVQSSSRFYPLEKPIRDIVGIDVHITITRGAGAKKVKWDFIIEGDPVGKWFVHYGFGAITPLNDFGTYHTQAIPDTNMFRITSDEERGLNIQYLPSIMFSFVPHQKRGARSLWSFTGGLGANADDIAVILGGSWFFYQNLGVTFHLVGKNQSILNGKYKEDGTSTVSENLDFDQLHDDKFKIYAGVSLTLRLDGNPFKQDSE